VNFEVSEKGGETRVVGLVELGDNEYEITLDGRTVRVDAARTGPTIYSVIEDGKQFEVVIDEQGAHGFDVLLGGRLLHLTAHDERSRLLASTAHAVVAGPQRVEAEMPGKVVKIAVPAGTAVREGQGVLILEAMKMENEITSPIDGVVTELGVSEGQTVEGGALLFVVEPPAEAEGGEAS
jgi:biotin carboxyl carrier protein